MARALLHDAGLAGIRSSALHIWKRIQSISCANGIGRMISLMMYLAGRIGALSFFCGCPWLGK